MNRRALCFGLFAATALALGMLMSPLHAEAAPQTRIVRWTPSSSAGVTKYLLSIGSSAGNYSAVLDLGLPAVTNGEMRFSLVFDDAVTHHIALRATNGAGYSAYSNEIVVARAVVPPTPPTPPTPTPPPPPPPGGGGGDPTQGTGPVGVDRTIVGLTGESSGLISVVYADGSTKALIGYPNPGIDDLRPAWCDLDADGTDDLVIGFGRGGRAELLLLILGENSVESSTVLSISGYTLRNEANQVVAYGIANGETWPACGDVDGDGRNEIVVGMGPGGVFKIHILDDITTFFAPMWPPGSLLPLAFGGIRQIAGSAIPAVGDVDGDGRAEIVIGRAPGGDGQVAVFDDASTNFRPIRSSADLGGSVTFAITIGDPAAYDGAVYPALGDIDGDGYDELVVGTGIGGAGKLFAFDDRRWNFRKNPVGEGTLTPLLVAGWDAYRNANGRTIPSLADIDGDGFPELSVGFGVGGEGRLQLFENSSQRFFAPSTYGPNGMLDTRLNRRIAPAMRRQSD